MTTSELMKAMSDAGAPFEAILIAVQALDAKDAEIAKRDLERTEKRAKDAERKRLDRAEGRVRKRRPRTFHGQSTDCPVDPPIEDHTPPISPDGENRAKRSKAIPAAKPDDVSGQVWTDWQAHRKRKGGTCTATALAGIRDEAEKAGWTLDAALRKAMSRNWQGFEAEWVKAETPKSVGPPGVDELAARILAQHANV